MPIWAKPFAPPPLKASPSLGLRWIRESCACTERAQYKIRKIPRIGFRQEEEISAILIRQLVYYKITERVRTTEGENGSRGSAKHTNRSGAKEDTLDAYLIVLPPAPSVFPKPHHNFAWPPTSSKRLFCNRIPLQEISGGQHIFPAWRVVFPCGHFPAVDV